MECPRISVEPAVAEKHGVFLAYTCTWRLSRSDPLDELLSTAEEEARTLYSLQGLAENPAVKALRRFYWRIGVDPTKQRPASEALLRRVLRGRSLPRINCCVDAGNAVSLLTLVPIGIYDVARLKPPLTLRYSRRGEPFHPIGGKQLTLDEEQIVLADTEKVVHIFPYRDGEDTKVTEATRDVLIVAAGVPGLEPQIVEAAARETADAIAEHCGGEAEPRVYRAP